MGKAIKNTFSNCWGWNVTARRDSRTEFELAKWVRMASTSVSSDLMASLTTISWSRLLMGAASLVDEYPPMEFEMDERRYSYARCSCALMREINSRCSGSEASNFWGEGWRRDLAFRCQEVQNFENKVTSLQGTEKRNIWKSYPPQNGRPSSSLLSIGFSRNKAVGSSKNNVWNSDTAHCDKKGEWVNKYGATDITKTWIRTFRAPSVVHGWYCITFNRLESWSVDKVFSQARALSTPTITFSPLPTPSLASVEVVEVEETKPRRCASNSTWELKYSSKRLFAQATQCSGCVCKYNKNIISF